MAKSLDIKHNVSQSLGLKQSHLLMMLPRMQQAIALLQVPVMELSQLIEQEVENNPLLEYLTENGEGDTPLTSLEQDELEVETNDDSRDVKEISFDEEGDFSVLKQLDEDFKDAERGEEYTHRTAEDLRKQTYFENSIVAPKNLNTYLLEQAKETFEEREDFKVAEVIIGNLNASGFLEVSLEELSQLFGYEKGKLEEILSQLQQFDPRGVAARSIQESLLIQLRAEHLESSLAYTIVSLHYDDLLHNRLPTLERALRCSLSDIHRAILQISKLDFHPGSSFGVENIQPIVADVSLKFEGDEMVVEVNRDTIPSLRLNRRYLRMLEDPTLAIETKDYIKKHLLSAKWFVKNIDQRNSTLARIVEEIKKRQRKFFLSPNGKMVPMTMKELGTSLDLHESTIARAVANKYVDSPRGLLPLRAFFTNAYVSDKGEDLSQHTVRNIVKQIIEEENKVDPHSDKDISQQLAKRGIHCARRTVAKHRYELKLGNALQRRKYV